MNEEKQIVEVPIYAYWETEALYAETQYFDIIKVIYKDYFKDSSGDNNE